MPFPSAASRNLPTLEDGEENRKDTLRPVPRREGHVIVILVLGGLMVVIIFGAILFVVLGIGFIIRDVVNQVQ